MLKELRALHSPELPCCKKSLVLIITHSLEAQTSQLHCLWLLPSADTQSKAIQESGKHTLRIYAHDRLEDTPRRKENLQAETNIKMPAWLLNIQNITHEKKDVSDSFTGGLLDYSSLIVALFQ